jgi:hypothetical protein
LQKILRFADSSGVKFRLYLPSEVDVNPARVNRIITDHFENEPALTDRQHTTKTPDL